jgi:hypothetical protein
VLIGEYVAALSLLRSRPFAGTAKLYEQPAATDSLGSFRFSPNKHTKGRFNGIANYVGDDACVAADRDRKFRIRSSRLRAMIERVVRPAESGNQKKKPTLFATRLSLREGR